MSNAGNLFRERKMIYDLTLSPTILMNLKRRAKQSEFTRDPVLSEIYIL